MSTQTAPRGRARSLTALLPVALFALVVSACGAPPGGTAPTAVAPTAVIAAPSPTTEARPTDAPQPQFTLHAIALDGQLASLRSDSQILWGPPLWVADASGAVILSGEGTTPEQTLVWVPAGEQPSVELVAGELMGSPRWGRP